MRAVAKREGVPVIELHDMTRTFFEALGYEGSKKALVHYPANTFPGQDKPLADNTHFNPYGAYEVAKMVVMGMKQLQLPVIGELKADCGRTSMPLILTIQTPSCGIKLRSRMSLSPMETEEIKNV